VAAKAAAALLLLLAMGGCSHYAVGIPLAPGLALGVGMGRDGSFSLGLNTGLGPLGAGVGVNQGGVVSGSVGAGVGAGPLGVGVSRSTVLLDPRATTVATGPANAVVAPAAGYRAVAATTGMSPLGTPGNPVAP
jgi:hypothetical protein